MLDNLAQDEALYLSDGHIYSDVNFEQPVKTIGLESLANPIDVAINMQISSANGIIKNSIWNKTGSVFPGDSVFTLSPGKRIGWANYSSVGQWFRPEPIWVAELNTQFVDDIIEQGILLDIKVNFNDNKNRWIQKKIIYSISEQ